MAVARIFLQLPVDPVEGSSLLQTNMLATFAFLFIALILFLFILLSRLRDGFRYANERWMSKKAQQFITSYMFNEDLDQLHVDRFKQKYLVKSTRCQVFMNSLLALHKNIVGEFADRLRLLYLQMGLHIHSKQKLYHSSWNVIADGINELAEMEMQQDVDLIRGFINHYNPDLRSVAQVAYLRLKRENPFSFLDELQEPLQEWQQMQLASAAHKAHIVMPDFKRWLGKEEISIVTFCIRMIALHNQHSATSDLIALLQHPSAIVRTEAIRAIRSLETFEARDAILDLYHHESTEIKLEIIKTLAVIGDEDLLPFYEEILGASERRLQIAAAKAIATCGRAGVALMQRIKDDIENSLQPVAANALDVRL